MLNFIPYGPWFKHHRVNLTIRPLSYFHDGQHLSLRRNSNTLLKNGVFWGKLCTPISTQGCFYDLFFVRGKLGVENVHDRD
jgi:hypothetical protein